MLKKRSQLAGVFASVALAFGLAVGPAPSIAQDTPSGHSQNRQDKSNISDPFADGALEVKIVNMGGCTSDDYTLGGDVVIKASFSDLRKLDGSDDQTDNVKRILAYHSTLDSLENAWEAAARRWTSQQIREKPDDVALDVMGRLEAVTDDLTKSTGVHFRIKNGKLGLTEDGPGCSLR